jgi:HK97 family phage major capsid protein
MNARAKATQLAKRIEELNAKQQAALDAAEAAGVTPEDRAKHLAAFDDLQKEKDAAKADHARFEQLARDQEWAGGPRTAPLVDSPFNPHKPSTGLHADGADGLSFDASRVRIPAHARRHGQLVAFRGSEREAYAAGVWCAAALASGLPDCVELAAHYRGRARELGVGFEGGPQAALTGLSNQSGGYFVPDVIETRVIELSLNYGIMRRLAEVVPMSSDTLTSPRWSSAMLSYWIGRGAKPTSSDPAWNAVQLIARDLGALTKIARQLSEDALIDLAEKVTVNIARAFALAEDNAGFNGDGSSTYGGILGLIPALALAANANSVFTATGHATVAALTNSDFLGVVGKAPNYPGADWRWLVHKQVWAQSMAALQLAAGGNNVASIAAGGQLMYLGYPVEWVNVMPSAPTTGTIAGLFADLSRSVKVGNRRGMTVQAGYENDDFTKQLMTLLGTERVDINCHTIVDPLADANAPGGPVMALKLG